MQLRALASLGALGALGLGLAACAPAQPPTSPRGPASTAPAAAAPAAPAAAPAAARESAAARAGQGQFDATGNIPCASAANQATRPCPFGVARGPGGEASVLVTKPDGRKRAIFFEGGRPVSADSAQADGSAGWRFNAQKRSDLFLISFGPERYEIPEAVVTGG